NGAAPPVSSTAPPAAPVPSALRRPASPPSGRRTPAPAGSRGGRPRAGRAPTAPNCAGEFQIGGNFRKNSLLNSLFSGNRPPAAHRRVQANQPVLGQLRAVEIQARPSSKRHASDRDSLMARQ